MIRRARPLYVVGLALLFNWRLANGVKPLISHLYSIQRAARGIIYNFKFSRAAQGLTPELTGREELYQAFKLSDEKQTNSAPVE
jgi:hypothetical protein